MSTALDYDWLREFGWHRIPRLERQPTDHVRRCVALETADDERFLVASEDLCIDLAPEKWPNPRFWFCWITKASSHNSPPHTFVHARHLKTRDDLILLYRGLTGREFGKPNWDRKKLAPVVVFESDEMVTQ